MSSRINGESRWQKDRSACDRRPPAHLWVCPAHVAASQPTNSAPVSPAPVPAPRPHEVEEKRGCADGPHSTRVTPALRRPRDCSHPPQVPTGPRPKDAPLSPVRVQGIPSKQGGADVSPSLRISLDDASPVLLLVQGVTTSFLCSGSLTAQRAGALRPPGCQTRPFSVHRRLTPSVTPGPHRRPSDPGTPSGPPGLPLHPGRPLLRSGLSGLCPSGSAPASLFSSFPPTSSLGETRPAASRLNRVMQSTPTTSPKATPEALSVQLR